MLSTQRKALAANSLIVILTHTYTLDVAESDGCKARDVMRHDGLGFRSSVHVSVCFELSRNLVDRPWLHTLDLVLAHFG